MPEDTRDVQATGELEDRVSPVPKISGGSAAESSELEGLDVGTLAKKMKSLEEKLSRLDKLDDIVDARVKSTKDKRVDGLFKNIDDLDRVISLFKEFDGDKHKIARELAVDRLLAGEVEGGDPGRSANQDERGDYLPEEEVAQSVTEILKKYKLTLTDPEVRELAFKNYQSLEEYHRDIDRIGKARFTQERQENVTGASVSGDAGQPAGGADLEALTQRLNELVSGSDISSHFEEIEKLRNQIDEASPMVRL